MTLKAHRQNIFGLIAMSLLATTALTDMMQAQEQRQSRDSIRAQAEDSVQQFPVLPQAITSFGAAVVGDYAYVYGGNHGEAHEYSRLGQSNELLRVNIQDPSEWEKLPESDRLQGLAMVAYDGNLYRVGGFAARNEAGEDQDLWSTDSFARFNIADNKWEELPPLPAPRSSHDATMLGSVLYVVGGWSMQGDAQTKWHDTAYAIDLAADELEWRELPAPPFQRRAISMAAAGGKMYVIGGMEPNGTTVEVACFDTGSNKWETGPSLPGEGMEGFGSSACAMDDQLFVSTYGGNVYKLDQDANAWAKVTTLQPGRFFHRMVPASNSLLLIGGANMDIGRFRETDVVSISEE